jgi:hypothetical protein
MASVVLSGDTSGSITLAAPAVAGSTTQTLVNVTGTLAPIVSGTAVASTSGTSIDFTSIPSWVKRITVMFSGVSTSGTSNILMQIGDSGGIENTGYVSQANSFNTSPNGSVSTAGYLLTNVTGAAGALNGLIPLCKIDGNNWACSGSIAAAAAAQGVSLFGGQKTLSDTLDRVRITTVNGTDTFDAGTINILYE